MSVRKKVLIKYWELKDSGEIRSAETLLLRYTKWLDDEVEALKRANDVDQHGWENEFGTFNLEV